MSTSLDYQPLPSISKSEYLSSLPRWRRWLAMLNWRPVVDYEIRAIEREQRLKQLQKEDELLESEFRHREIAHEKRMQQLESEIAQIKSETARLKSENARLANEDVRLAELDAKIAALWPSSTSSSTPTQSPANDSPI